jgi:allophanate hydrolase
MAEARFTVRACGPLVSYQDGGRPGMMRFGVAASGPMDRLAHAAAQAALGQPQGATALEVSLGGLELACDAGEVSFSVTGGEFQVVHAGAIVKSGCVRTIRAGETLAIRPGRWGSWAYLAFCGELACRPWAGRAATHSTSGLGGGLLASGSTIVVRESAVCEEREGELAAPAFTPAQPRVRVVLGPQTEHFEAGGVERLLAEDYSVSPACDRMGMRLEGPALPTTRPRAAIPRSPPSCRATSTRWRSAGRGMSCASKRWRPRRPWRWHVRTRLLCGPSCPGWGSAAARCWSGSWATTWSAG